MMQYRRTSLATVVVAAAVALSGCGSNDADAGSGMGGDMGMSSSAPGGMGTGTDRGATGTEQDAADVMFVQMMIPHHEQAIEMSDLVSGKIGVDPRVTDVAERIKAAQGPEIDLMSGWLEDWGVRQMPADGMAGMDHGGMGGAGMGGMMSEDDMQALADSEGVAASRLFLEGMIEHHEGAIDMAQAELDDGQDTQVLDLARQIIEAQEAEITEMQGILADL